ncbi:hypothetical protein Tco_0621904 [Tanacetum coccineum]
MHTTMVIEQVKIQKSQAEVQVSRPEDKDVIFSIGSALEDFILLYFVLVKNIQILSQDIKSTAMNSCAAIVDYVGMEKSFVDEYKECLALKAELVKKKYMVEKDVKNKKAHVDYLKQTKEHADTLCEIVEQVRSLKPLDSALDYACKFATQIQELLVYVSATCHVSRNDSEKLVAVTPMNKNRQVRFVEPSTSTSNTQKQVEALSNQNTNRSLLSST